MVAETYVWTDVEIQILKLKKFSGNAKLVFQLYEVLFHITFLISIYDLSEFLYIIKLFFKILLNN